MPQRRLDLRLPPPAADPIEDLAQLVLAMDPEHLEVWSQQLDPDDLSLVEEILADRAAAGWRVDPATMAAFLDPSFEAWRYMRFLAGKFVDGIEGRSPRQIWSMPSRMGKTSLIRWCLAFGLDREPRSRWIYETYGDGLALETGDAVRQILRAHADALRVSLRRDMARRDRFLTPEGGGLLCRGFGSGVIGFGAGVPGLAAAGGGMFIDDPMKNWQEAHSPSRRKKVVDHFFGVLRHRIDEESVPIFVVHARWHAEDLSGELQRRMEDETGEAWEIIKIPALAVADDPADDPLGRAKGEPIEAARFTREQVLSRHLGMADTFIVEAIEQQQPLPDQGIELLREWFILAESAEQPRRADEAITCLPGTALVLTEGGPRRIEEVRVGERVWSLDESSKSFRLSRVWRAEQSGRDEILRIETNGRTLRCNAQHRVLVRRKHPAPRSGSGGHRAVEWRNDWIRAGEIVRGDLLVAAHGLPDGKNDEAPNGRILTEEFMAFAGLMVGDGSVVDSAVSVARHPDAPYADTYKGFAERSFRRTGPGDRIGVPRGHVPRSTAPIHWHSYMPMSMVFSSASAATELRELGFAGVATTKRVPEWVFGLRPDLILAFLRGYLDADGAVNERGHITYSSVNPDLLEDVRHLCMILGIQTSRVCRYDTEGTRLIMGRWCARRDMFQVFLFDVVANRRIGSHHPNKAAHLQASRKAKGRGDTHVDRWQPGYVGAGSPGSRPGESFKIQGGALVTVTDVIGEPAEMVYDLGVEGTHSFIADGVIVHNSWDLKLKNREAGDYVVGQVWWRVGSVYWLMDTIRGKYDHATTENAIALLAVRHPEASRHIIEAAGSADEVIPELRKPIDGYTISPEMQARLGMSDAEVGQVEAARRSGLAHISPNAAQMSKEIRARTYIAPAAEAGQVRMPAEAPWVAALLSELAAFGAPGDHHDDQVDAMSQAIQKLRKGGVTVKGPAHTARRPVPMPGVQRTIGPRRGSY